MTVSRGTLGPLSDALWEIQVDPWGAEVGIPACSRKLLRGGGLVCNPRRKVFYSTDFQFYWFNVQWGSLTSTAPTPPNTHI